MDWLKIILENLLPVVVTIATPILLLLANILVKHLAAKWKFNVNEVQLAKLDDLIAQGIGYAEEQAHKACKLSATTPPAGVEKLDIALKFVVAQSEAMGLPQKAVEVLTQLIEAKVNESRTDATPAIG